MTSRHRDYGIPGTPVFDGEQAQKGYALNKMCYSFNSAENRAEFLKDERDLKVLVMGTGGLSHQLEGQRAGHINKEFDLMCLEKLVDDPEALTRYSIIDLVKLAGSQGVEVIMWLIMRGALAGKVTKVHSNYHIPISNTASGILLLDNRT